jgi:hypothetical protein
MTDVTSKATAAEKSTAAAKDDEAQRANDVRANAVAAMEEVEAMQPTPTQDELNKIHRSEPGGYKTRQSKAS